MTDERGTSADRGLLLLVLLLYVFHLKAIIIIIIIIIINNNNDNNNIFIFRIGRNSAPKTYFLASGLNNDFFAYMRKHRRKPAMR